MKISELQELLEKAKEEYGDIDIRITRDYRVWNKVEGIRITEDDVVAYGNGLDTFIDYSCDAYIKLY